MNKIRTYNDLLKEEQRLEQQLKVQEAVIRKDLADFKENFEPVKRIFSTAQKIFTRDNRVPVFNIGLELIIDILLRRVILKRAGWIAKSIVPYIVKNYSSHIMGEEKRKALVKKIRDVFSKLRPGSKAAQPTPGEQPA